MYLQLLTVHPLLKLPASHYSHFHAESFRLRIDPSVAGNFHQNGVCHYGDSPSGVQLRFRLRLMLRPRLRLGPGPKPGLGPGPGLSTGGGSPKSASTQAEGTPLPSETLTFPLPLPMATLPIRLKGQLSALRNLPLRERVTIA